MQIEISMRFQNKDEINTIKKIVMLSELEMFVKYEIDGVTHKIVFDSRNIFQDIAVINSTPSVQNILRVAFLTSNRLFYQLSRWSLEESTGGDQLVLVSKPNTYPEIIYKVEGEDELTNEVADRTIVFPPRETRYEWADRLRRILTLKAREFVDGIDSGWIDLKSKSRNLAGDTQPLHTVGLVDPDVMNLRAYDNVANWMRLLIGYAWQQIAAVIDGGDDAPTREEVEALIDTVANNLTHKEMVEDFFHDHDVTAWWVQHQERKIVLANHDERFTPNTDDVVHDINENHRTLPLQDSSKLEINHRTAEEEFHECVTTDFDRAWKNKNRTLITERTVTIPEPDSE